MTLRKKVLACLCLLGSFVFIAFIIRTQATENGSFRIDSPLPNIFTDRNQQVLATHDYWKPNITQKVEQKDEYPEFSALSVLAYDIESNQLLYEKEIKKKLPLASLTKIMTAIVAIENEDLEELVTVSKRSAEIGENSMGLKESEQFTRRELLYGLILPSGNDSAEVLAETSSVGRDNFVFLMNKKAEQLGLTDTRFTNPSGLEGDGNQYSTAYDLLVITRYALQIPLFAEIVSTVEKELPESRYHRHYRLFNDTNLLTTYPGVKGVKTGYTYEAGMCLITYLEYGGKKIIAVILNSQNRREEMKILLDYSLSSLGVEPPNIIQHP